MNTTDLINSIKSVASSPTVQGRFDEEHFLLMCDEEIQSGILPLILDQKEDYLSFDQDITLKANKFSYPLPDRAIGNKLREVAFLRPDGNVISIHRLELDDIGKTSGLTGFYLKGNRIILQFNQLDTTLKLRLTYFIRPSKLILSSKAAKVISVSIANGQTIVQVSSTPTELETSLIDIIRGGGAHECLLIDQEPNISGNTFIFDQEIDDLKKGDYLAVAGQSPFTQIPFELNPLLVQKAAFKVLQSSGDLEALQVVMATLEKLEKAAVKLLSPRVEGESKVIRNPSNPLNFV